MNQIQILASRPTRTANSVLSVYLDVDTSKSANLNRGFETQLKDMLVSIRDNIRQPAEVKAFEEAAHHLENFVARYGVAARGLAVIFDASDGFFWFTELNFPMANMIRWGKDVFVQPLAAAIDEYEQFAIVLLDRARFRLFTMSGGKIEEQIQEEFDHRRVRHTKTVGTDHLGSASHAQRRADEQVLLNLRHMAKDLAAVVEQRGMQRIVLAGSSEITAQFQAILPKRLRSRVIGRVDIASNAHMEEIRNAAAPIAERFERESEANLMKDLVTAAAKSNRVVTGLSHTLHAVNQRRVWQLVYGDGFRSPGLECAQCAALYSLGISSCSFCGATLHPVEDVIELAVERAIRYGARVEAVRDQESLSSLMNAGGIGAFLRTRSSSVRAS
jgi:hypothetical protein